MKKNNLLILTNEERWVKQLLFQFRQLGGRERSLMWGADRKTLENKKNAGRIQPQPFRREMLSHADLIVQFPDVPAMIPEISKNTVPWIHWSPERPVWTADARQRLLEYNLPQPEVMMMLSVLTPLDQPRPQSAELAVQMQLPVTLQTPYALTRVLEDQMRMILPALTIHCREVRRGKGEPSMEGKLQLTWDSPIPALELKTQLQCSDHAVIASQPVIQDGAQAIQSETRILVDSFEQFPDQNCWQFRLMTDPVQACMIAPAARLLLALARGQKINTLPV